MTEINKPIRCAIYCRKSSDENLDMQFNSLDAQREAGEAYIASQKFKGWVCLEKRYEDGGFSGGNINRPALLQLQEDIKNGEIDVVVVYKIDRLSRSLLDFSSLFTLFETNNVTFVSVTQDINTSSSSGRMMLNILMTFAQFERDVITERIRDKVAAAKKKGMRCGGPPPMGYKSNSVTKKLEVVPEEAEIIKKIFTLYLKLGSARDVATELDADGLKIRTRVSCKGKIHGGQSFTGSYIYQVLQNITYIGLVKHYDKTYDGEHDAIIDKGTWDNVHALLQENVVHNGKQTKRLTPLRGLVKCGCCNGVMFENFTQKSKSTNYRYFTCSRDMKRIHSTCPLKRVPAAELEKVLLDEISNMLSTPEMYASILNSAKELSPNGKHLKPKQIERALGDLSQVWSMMFPVEQYKFIRAIIKEIVVYPDKVTIEYNMQGLENVLAETEEI